MTNLVKPDQKNPSIAHLNEVFFLQKNAFKKDPYPSLKQRIQNLDKLSKALMKHRRALIDAMNEDFSHRSPFESGLIDIIFCVQTIRYQKKNLKKWMKESKRHPGIMNMPGKAKVIYQPLGVVGIISPWNYPINLAAIPLATSLAAGNRSIIKMSEFTPKTAEAFRTMLAEAFDESLVSVITGEADVAETFSEKPWDHLIFTGSTDIGKRVMRAAAEHLTPVTLELGGKSPVIISNDVPLEDAAQRLVFGKCINAGQTCIAPDYIMVPEHRMTDFVSTLSNIAAKMFPSLVGNDGYTAIINERQFVRLQSYIKDAEEKGGTVITLNPGNESFEGTRKMPLHLILNVNDDMVVMKEEIFGPILPIVGYKSLDDAINYVNERPRPLALYYFDYNKKNVEVVLRRTHSGGVSVNETLLHFAVEDMPFGGIGPSGLGCYHGPEGFRTLSFAKSVFIRHKFNPMKFIYPPWNKGLAKRILDFSKKL